MARKLLIDINVILDVALLRQPHYRASQQILSLIDLKKADGFFSAISCATVYYLLKKELTADEAAEYVRELLGLLSVVEVNRHILDRALAIQVSDFEDAIQSVCAEKCRAEYILTRDARGYKASSVRAITPDEYLATFSP